MQLYELIFTFQQINDFTVLRFNPNYAVEIIESQRDDLIKDRMIILSNKYG